MIYRIVSEDKAGFAKMTEEYASLRTAMRMIKMNLTIERVAKVTITKEAGQG